MGARYDAIVIGGGRHGLAAATRLAAGGKRTLLTERRGVLGGLCARREIHPGFVVPGLLHDDGRLAPRVARRLDLARHGLAFAPLPAVYLAEEGGRGLLLDRDPKRAHEELAARSPRDAAAYGRLRAFLGRVEPLIERLFGAAPPPLTPHSLRERLEAAGLGLGLLRASGGRRATLELLRVAPMCVADFLNEQLETPLLVEALAAIAVAGTWSGPWSAGTTTNLLLAEAHAGQGLAGGPPALVAALERAARAAGAELRTGAEVRRIVVRDGRAAGVELADGELVEAAIVVATGDPKRAMLELVEPATLPIGIEDEFRRIRMRGTLAKVHLALAAPLAVAARPGQRFAALAIGGGHVDELERAFDAVKYGQPSRRPHLDVRVPSVLDPSLAPAGGEVVSIAVSYVPHTLAGGWTAEHRAALLETVLGRLEVHAPGVRASLVGSEVLTPADLEQELALTGGQVHHGELALDQLLFLRPAPSAARYATVVPGLYLGGSGSHAGPGIGCTAGLLAADAALG